MKYFIAGLITLWLAVSVYLFINLVIYFRFFGNKIKTVDDKALKNYERINIAAFDETILTGKLIVPADGDGEKTVVLFHSHGSSCYKDFQKEIETYKTLGYNILLPDQRCHGKSQGKLSTRGVFESYDVAYWCNWLELRFSTGCPIVIHGKEMGAFGVMTASAGNDLPQNVTKVVCDSPYESIFGLFSSFAEEKYGMLSKMIIPVVNMFSRLYAGFDMREFSLKKLSKKVKFPVLFVNTDKNSDIVKNAKAGVIDQPLEKFLCSGE